MEQLLHPSRISIVLDTLFVPGNNVKKMEVEIHVEPMDMKFGLRELDFFRKYGEMVGATFAEPPPTKTVIEKPEFDGTDLAQLTSMKDEEKKHHQQAVNNSKQTKFALNEEEKVLILI